MMKKIFGKTRKVNNSGSAMIVSIIVLLFVSILATVILYMAGINYRMKKSDLNTRVSFYSSETTLEAMQTDLVVPLSYALNEGYMATNSKYLDLGSSDARREAFYISTYDALEDLLIKQYGGAKIGNSGEHLTDSTLIKNIVHNLTYDTLQKDASNYLESNGVDVTAIFVNDNSVVPDAGYSNNPTGFITALCNAPGGNCFPDNFDQSANNYMIVYGSVPSGTADSVYRCFVELSIYEADGVTLLPPEKCRIVFKNIGSITCQNGYRSYVTTDIAMQFPPLDWSNGGSTTFELDPSAPDVKWDIYQLLYYVNWQKS